MNAPLADTPILSMAHGPVGPLTRADAWLSPGQTAGHRAWRNSGRFAFCRHGCNPLFKPKGMSVD